MKSAPSPGNVYSPNLPPTHIPSLEFIYRLECGMSPDEQVVGRPSTSQNSRIILPITGGTVLGPEISGIIVPSSGADWATSLPNESFMRLDARYTLKTDDGFFIYVRSKGIYQPNPSLVSPDATPPTMITQDQAEWFTRLQFESSSGPYEWMNYVFAVGVLTMHEGSVIIDAYKLTNLLGRESSSLTARC